MMVLVVWERWWVTAGLDGESWCFGDVVTVLSPGDGRARAPYLGR